MNKNVYLLQERGVQFRVRAFRVVPKSRCTGFRVSAFKGSRAAKFVFERSWQTALRAAPNSSAEALCVFVEQEPCKAIMLVHLRS